VSLCMIMIFKLLSPRLWVRKLCSGADIWCTKAIDFGHSLFSVQKLYGNLVEHKRYLGQPIAAQGIALGAD